MNAQEIQHFAREHKKALMLLFAATQDYAAARCLLLNGLFSGLAIGSQALEKYLKAAILLADPAFPVRRLAHSISEAWQIAAPIFPEIGSSGFSEIADRFTLHYRERYPDNPNQTQSKSTGELAGLDQFIVAINENLPCPLNVKFRSGLYAAITRSIEQDGFLWSEELWIKKQNFALGPKLPDIEKTYYGVMEEIYSKPPQTT